MTIHWHGWTSCRHHQGCYPQDRLHRSMSRIKVAGLRPSSSSNISNCSSNIRGRGIWVSRGWDNHSAWILLTSLTGSSVSSSSLLRPQNFSIRLVFPAWIPFSSKSNKTSIRCPLFVDGGASQEGMTRGWNNRSNQRSAPHRHLPLHHQQKALGSLWAWHDGQILWGGSVGSNDGKKNREGWLMWLQLTAQSELPSLEGAVLPPLVPARSLSIL